MNVHVDGRGGGPREGWCEPRTQDGSYFGLFERKEESSGVALREGGELWSDTALGVQGPVNYPWVWVFMLRAMGSC